MVHAMLHVRDFFLSAVVVVPDKVLIKGVGDD